MGGDLGRTFADQHCPEHGVAQIGLDGYIRHARFDKFTSMQVVTLMRDSFATRLEDPSFMTAVNALLDRLGPSKWSRS